jgi:hypothetical protein
MALDPVIAGSSSGGAYVRVTTVVVPVVGFLTVVHASGERTRLGFQ